MEKRREGGEVERAKCAGQEDMGRKG